MIIASGSGTYVVPVEGIKLLSERFRSRMARYRKRFPDTVMDMRPEDLHRFLRHRPFRPFRLTLTDGRTFEILHPELVMVGRSTAEIGLPSPHYEDPTFDRVITISLLHVMQVDFIPESDAG